MIDRVDKIPPDAPATIQDFQPLIPGLDIFEYSLQHPTWVQDELKQKSWLDIILLPVRATLKFIERVSGEEEPPPISETLKDMQDCMKLIQHGRMTHAQAQAYVEKVLEERHHKMEHDYLGDDPMQQAREWADQGKQFHNSWAKYCAERKTNAPLGKII